MLERYKAAARRRGRAGAQEQAAQVERPGRRVRPQLQRPRHARVRQKLPAGGRHAPHRDARPFSIVRSIFCSLRSPGYTSEPPPLASRSETTPSRYAQNSSIRRWCGASSGASSPTKRGRGASGRSAAAGTAGTHRYCSSRAMKTQPSVRGAPPGAVRAPADALSVWKMTISSTLKIAAARATWPTR